LGRIRELPLSNETQGLFVAGMALSRSRRTSGKIDGKNVPNEIRQASQSLTVREWQVFDLLISGLSNKLIAHELAISPRTVEIHRAHLMKKMGVRNAASLVRIALTAA
jgi:FixJ family two-component response regulator